MHSDCLLVRSENAGYMERAPTGSLASVFWPMDGYIPT